MAIKKTFEASMEKLEKLVAELEGDNTGLDESIDKFEEGMKLIKECRSALGAARQRVTKIIENGEETDFEGE